MMVATMAHYVPVLGLVFWRVIGKTDTASQDKHLLHLPTYHTVPKLSGLNQEFVIIV